MGVNTKTTMEETKHGKTAVSVEEIISGVRSCNIGVDSSTTNEVGRMLENLSLENNKDVKLQTPTELVSQPIEGDKATEEHSGTDRNGETVEDQRVDETDNLVTLEAPSFDDEEEDDSEQSLDEEIVDCLGERGPMVGVPSKTKSSQPGNFCKPSDLQVPMPPNFPHSYKNINEIENKGHKRLMDETRPGAPKYVRPQDAVVLGEIDYPSAAPASVKTISSVQLNQMAGGTVYTLEKPQTSTDQNYNKLNGSQNSLTIPDFLDLVSEKSSFTIPRVINLLENHDSVLENDVSMQRYPMENDYMNVDLYQQKGFNQQQNHFPTENQKFKRGSSDDYSEGYGSDLSPPHETPQASPRSFVGASPPAVNGSPLWRNLSSPPSNKSQHSFDSGVSSPVSEDLGGYTSQKSPRHGYGFNSMTTVLGPNYQARMNSCALPHHSDMSPTHMIISHNNKTLSHVALQQENKCPSWKVPNDSPAEEYFSDYVSKNPDKLKDAIEFVKQDLIEIECNEYRVNPQKSMTSVPESATEVRIDSVSIKNVDICGDIAGRVSQCHFQTKMLSNVTDVLLNRNAKGNPGINGVLRPSLQTTALVFTTTTMSTPNPSVVTTSKLSQPSLNNPSKISHVLVAPETMSRHAVNTNVAINQHVMNKDGKIAIQPITQKKSAQSPDQTVPLFIIIQPKTPVKKSLRLIAPKDPTKQAEKTVDSVCKPTNITSPQINNCNTTCQEGKLSDVLPVNEKNVDEGSDAKCLNLARRVVAEMSESDLKYKDEDDEDTYLHIAVCRDFLFMLQALLERLVRERLTHMINVQNLQGQTPLYLAVSTNNAEMVRLLVEYGADANKLAESKTSAGAPEKLAAIHIVSTKGDKYLKTLQALLRAPAINLNQVNSDGHTALHCAILAHGKVSTDMTHINSIPIIQALIHAGADPNLPVQQSGKTALMYALESRDLDLIEKTFQLVEPSKLATVLNTRAFDKSSCLKIADSIKTSLDQAGQQRLLNCFKPGTNRVVLGTTF